MPDNSTTNPNSLRMMGVGFDISVGGSKEELEASFDLINRDMVRKWWQRRPAKNIKIICSDTQTCMIRLSSINLAELKIVSCAAVEAEKQGDQQ